MAVIVYYWFVSSIAAKSVTCKQDGVISDISSTGLKLLFDIRKAEEGLEYMQEDERPRVQQCPKTQTHSHHLPLPCVTSEIPVITS